eukprot:11264470-Ditylum_brightwellii.AAC.1
MMLDKNTTTTCDKTNLMDRPVESNCPDIVLTEEDEHTKYRNLEIVIKKNHKLLRVHTIPVVVGVFGAVCCNLDISINQHCHHSENRSSGLNSYPSACAN